MDMFTISNILEDIKRNCAVYNLNENAFLYRIVFFVNEESASRKYYVDAQYENLRQSLENIVRENLSLTNTLVIAQTTVLLNGRCVCLQSRSYKFSLERYFQLVTDKQRRRNTIYSRRYTTAI